MQIKRLIIENFKSIERIELIEPNPFTVFVGPNGSGKSNIFEALEFVTSWTRQYPSEAIRLFGGFRSIGARKAGPNQLFHFDAEFDSYPNRSFINYDLSEKPETVKEFVGISGSRAQRHQSHPTSHTKPDGTVEPTAATQFFLRYSRLFVKNLDLLRFPYQDDRSLNLAATNLEPVLKRVLADKWARFEIFEWLELFVPGFKAVEVDERNELHWFEESTPDYFTKDLISDGTYNILALLAAIYQDKHQFLCIEEPENGLNPRVVQELVPFFRLMCEERGHTIWVNTHSQSLVAQLKPEELVVVDKKIGTTTIRQLAGEDFYGMPMDEAWLTNSLNGGLPW